MKSQYIKKIQKIKVNSSVHTLIAEQLRPEFNLIISSSQQLTLIATSGTTPRQNRNSASLNIKALTKYRMSSTQNSVCFCIQHS